MTESEKYKLSTYQTIQILHQTATSVVELVECSLDGRRYVKKTYPADKRVVYQTLSQIHSIYIPEIHELLFGDDTIVIEQYIEGKTLEQLINGNHVFSKDEISIIADGLISALTTLHSNDVIHRDIKPSNIIVRPNGQAVLIDYSIARPYSNTHGKDTELLGTVGYAAPEQFGFSQSDYRTDLYAFGITMKAIASQHNTSKHLYNAIARCAEFDPSRRFQTVAELRTYIDKKKRANTFVLLAGGAVVLGLVILFIVLFIQNEQHGSTDNLVYEASASRIVDTSDIVAGVPCLPMPEDGVYDARISLSEKMHSVDVHAVKDGGNIEITINDETTFTIDNEGHPDSVAYPDSEVIAEILFYDIDADGVLEVFPIICDALLVDYLNNGDISMLENYSMAWCIYYDADLGFKQAEGTMISRFDTFRIFASIPDGIQADFPSYYTLDNGAITMRDY